MDLVGSPFITMFLNIIAGALVSRGILDQHARDTFVQLANNVIAAAVTLGIAVYSVYKTVDLHKHRLTSQSTQSTVSVTTAGAVPAVTQETPVVPVEQTGLPAGQ